ncbi:MAG: hypothetical protein SVY53_09650 [Chloroflexota bacterium]|nr:hypothetical protein [Chloroflexota bacterium]
MESLWNNYIGGSLDGESLSGVSSRRSSSASRTSLLTQWHRHLTLSMLLVGALIFVLTGLHIIPRAFVIAGLLMVIIGIGLADSSDVKSVCDEVPGAGEEDHLQP